MPQYEQIYPYEVWSYLKNSDDEVIVVIFDDFIETSGEYQEGYKQGIYKLSTWSVSRVKKMLSDVNLLECPAVFFKVVGG